MDITLDTSFNNPRLPFVPRPGLVDGFNRPAASTLGRSDDGKQWLTRTSSGSTPGVWGTTGTGRATLISSGMQNQLAIADTLASDGTLTAKLASILPEAGSRRAGLVIRALDGNNFISIAPVSPSIPDLRIRATLGGTSSASLSGSVPALAAGDVLSVAFAGPSITVYVNGVQKLTGSITELQDATHHGLYAFGGAQVEWDSIEFVPA